MTKNSSKAAFFLLIAWAGSVAPRVDLEAAEKSRFAIADSLCSELSRKNEIELAVIQSVFLGERLYVVPCLISLLELPDTEVMILSTKDGQPDCGRDGCSMRLHELANFLLTRIDEDNFTRLSCFVMSQVEGVTTGAPVDTWVARFSSRVYPLLIRERQAGMEYMMLDKYLARFSTIIRETRQ